MVDYLQTWLAICLLVFVQLLILRETQFFTSFNLSVHVLNTHLEIKSLRLVALAQSGFQLHLFHFKNTMLLTLGICQDIFENLPLFILNLCSIFSTELSVTIETENLP